MLRFDGGRDASQRWPDHSSGHVCLDNHWRYVELTPDGETHGFEGRYREVTPQDRIVRTFEWDGMPGYTILETAEFTDLGDGRTRVVGTSLFFTPEERDGMLHSGMEGGMAQSYAALDGVLASLR